LKRFAAADAGNVILRGGAAALAGPAVRLRRAVLLARSLGLGQACVIGGVR
jgi:hypothetical protein